MLKQLLFVLSRIFKNKTYKQEIFNFTKDLPNLKQYEIGIGTYGEPKIISWNDGTTVSIGKFCSIADQVEIMLGGEHNYKWATTYPFKTLARELFGETVLINDEIPIDRHSKGNVTIGNDVWIGRKVLILSGVRIGHGAIVGAGSIVTKDVPNYAIVAGNPAVIIKYRFPQNKIKLLLDIRWWDWSKEEIVLKMPILLSENFEELQEHN